MPARKLPDNDRLLKWLSEGKTHRQIVELSEKETGVRPSESAVRVAVSRLGATGRRPTYGEWLPWTVSAKHNKAYQAVMLRAYARYKKAGEDPDALPRDLYVRLRNWLALLKEPRPNLPHGEVVDYNHDTGFSYVRARADEDVIRRPKNDRHAQRTRKAS